MKWLEVEITAEPEWQDTISEIFMDLGIQGMEIVDPEAFRAVLEKNRYLDYADDVFIDSFGDKVVVRAYFHADYDTSFLERQLSDAFDMHNIDPNPKLLFRVRDDSEWKDNWRNNYKSFLISERVIVKPSWEACNYEDGRVVVEIDPGMAFGTGTHETTRMCAKFIDELIKGNEYILDLGCGTGILGIIAALLGAEKVTCVDIDEAACFTAKENIIKNHVEDKISVLAGELKDVEKRGYDIIIVNIITDVIISLIPELKDYCKPGTNIFLSGIIKERRQEVLEKAALHGFRPVQELNEREWVAIRLCIDS
jgi:ribosomal protein L11 methyltransferase